MSGHEKYGFCWACGTPSCVHSREIEYKLGELYTKTGTFYEFKNIDLNWLDLQLAKPDNYKWLTYEKRDKNCICNDGYNVLCPKHGIKL